jgi:hypothetical protein
MGSLGASVLRSGASLSLGGLDLILSLAGKIELSAGDYFSAGFILQIGGLHKKPADASALGNSD